MGDSLPAKRFESHLRHLKQHYEVIGLDSAVGVLRGEHSPRSIEGRPMAVISVDDGFGDNCAVMAPLMRAFGLPATVFLATDFLDSERAPWPTQLSAIVHQAQTTRIEYPFAASLASAAERSAVAARIKKEWKTLEPEQRGAALTELAHHVKVSSLKTQPPLTWQEVREMRRGGITFGSHTVYHSLLPFVSKDAVVRELRDSKMRIEQELGEECRWLAYPNGDYDHEVIALAKRAGYGAALTQDAGVNEQGGDLMALRRIQVPHDESLACFACRASLIAA